MAALTELQKYVTVNDAAEIIGCTPGRVRQMIYAEQIEATQIGHLMWLVSRKNAEKIAREPSKVGRPRIGKK